MDLPNRKPTRLKEYDYSSPGAYFITICVKDKKHILGKIVGGDAHIVPKNELTPIGEIVDQEILKIESAYTNIHIDKYVIMPNHIHMIIRISEPEGINPFPTMKKYDISNVIGKFKAGVTRSVGNAFMHSEKKSIWQSSFHDHIIRNKQDYKMIWEYIDTNPIQWEDDCFYNE